MADVTLTEDEREALLVPCKCGHSINDHGSVCWVCAEGTEEDCPGVPCVVEFETLLKERLEAIVAARVAAALGEVEARISGSVPVNYGIRHDGTEDPQASAYVEGVHTAWTIVREVRGEVGG